ncbi:peptidoglycan D,D-transpeptidase FtsI family protein [Anaerosinus massiliensis]|uniref:peptidoglycan D,D-transpeptidase FtsI family protein n=1 Tax=Massilibacillus massiliensis TaxID=1806837 RepID=UPI000AB1DC80|nr:penicillin-binding protein 2 [Massilibacillus massiliensis]
MAFSVKRIYYILLMFSVLGVVIFIRLFYLQIIMGKDLAISGLFSRVQEVELRHERGEIFDRNLNAMTNRNKHYDVTIFPSQLKDKYDSIAALAKYSGIPESNVYASLDKAVKPIKFAENVPKKAALAIKSKEIHGVLVNESTNRYSDVASHVIGYCNLIDNRGMSGLEAMYDEKLRFGSKEYLAAVIDARSNLIPGLSYRKFNLEKRDEKFDLILTMDNAIQRSVEQAFDKYATKGAVIVMEPKTGDVLAMVSRPNFDATHLEQYLNGENGALLNRAISAYPPGSVFKLVVAAAALEQNLVSLNESFIDKGFIDVDGTKFRRWDYKSGTRKITFQDAIAYSSNPVLIEVGLRMGMKNLVNFAEKIGFGERTSLSFYNEMQGNLPAQDNIYRGELANLSIGQGECEVTPIQMAAFVSTIVNYGIKVNPVLVSAIIDENGEKINMRDKKEAKRIFSLETAEKIKKMMIAVNQYGTGQAAWIENGGSAGKTGSAETGRKGTDGKGINHAWYVGFSPIEEPKYVVAIFVEDGMSGGDVAAPIFKEIIEKIL